MVLHCSSKLEYSIEVRVADAGVPRLRMTDGSLACDRQCARVSGISICILSDKDLTVQESMKHVGFERSENGIKIECGKRQRHHVASYYYTNPPKLLAKNKPRLSETRDKSFVE